MADVDALARDVRSWAPDWSETATLAVISHVRDIEIATNHDHVVLERVPRVLLAAWRTFVVEVEVQNGGFYQYFWNKHADIAASTAGDFDMMSSPEFAVVQRAAVTAYTAVAARLEELRAADPPYGSVESYLAGLQIANFSAVDDAWGEAYAREPVRSLIDRWLSTRPDEVADAILATRALPGASKPSERPSVPPPWLS